MLGMYILLYSLQQLIGNSKMLKHTYHWSFLVIPGTTVLYAILSNYIMELYPSFFKGYTIRVRGAPILLQSEET
jgi:hypothetical protein